MGTPMSKFDWEVLYERYYKQEGLDFNSIEEIKNDPIDDLRYIKIYEKKTKIEKVRNGN